MSKDKSGNDDDEGSAALKEAEAKEASLTNYFTSLKMGANILVQSLKAREGDRAATQSKRPMKDTPVDYLSAGSGKDPALSNGGGGVAAQNTDMQDEGDQGSGSGTDSSGGSGDDGSGSSSSGGESGGGPRMDPAPDSGYVSFADTASETRQNIKAEAKKSGPDLLTQEQEKADQKGPETLKKGDASAKVSGPQQAGPASGGKGGPAGGPSQGPGGSKGGGGPSVGL